MSNKKYIEVNALLDKIFPYGMLDGGNYPIQAKAVRKAIEGMATTEVVELKRGEWVYNPNGMDWGLGAWECSECHCKNDNLGMSKEINPYLFAGGQYCPHCGAKMVRKGDKL